MTDQSHTPLPWNAASAYSSLVGVPIVNQNGQRVGNTALPNLPSEWTEMKERAVADAALIVRSVNSLPSLVKALEEIARGCDEDGRGAHDGEIVKLVRAERIARAALSAYRGEGK